MQGNLSDTPYQLFGEHSRLMGRGRVALEGEKNVIFITCVVLKYAEYIKRTN